MGMKKRLLAGALAALLIAGGCSERVTNTNADIPFTVTLDPGAAQALTDLSLFRVIVTRSSGDTILTRTLTLEGNQLVGTITSLAANQTLLFTVEAADAATGIVVYKGSATARVLSYTNTTVNIALAPVSPLLRFSPGYLEVGPDLLFSVDTKLFNLPHTYGISYRVLWATDLNLAVDSIVANPDLENDPSVILFTQAGGGASAESYYAFSITETDTSSAIVDDNGDLDLVRLYCRLTGHLFEPGYFDFALEVTSLTAIDNGQIIDLPVDTLFVDGCIVSDPMEYTVGR